MFIEFGILNLKLLILFLHPIANYLDLYLSNLFSSSYSLSMLYSIFMNSIYFLSAGLIYLIIIYRSKTSKKVVVSVSAIKGCAINQIENERKKEKKNKKEKKKYLYFY